MELDATDIRIGTARWNIPFAEVARVDPARKREGTLARYARRFEASEVNSSFWRHHRPSTWLRWGQTVPPDFRFSAKLPRAITHEAKLELGPSVPVLERFLLEVSHLGDRRGPLLVQLPPSLAFDAALVEAFLVELRSRWNGMVACEPRHASWFDGEADALLARHLVARVAADPVVAAGAGEPGGWDGLAYVRLHGSPRTYHSSYDEAWLDALAERVRALAAGPARAVWCIFDNTASGAALPDALGLLARLGADAPAARSRPGDGGPRYRIISST